MNVFLQVCKLQWSIRGGVHNTFFNPLSPNIHLQILHTDLYTFP